MTNNLNELRREARTNGRVCLDSKDGIRYQMLRQRNKATFERALAHKKRAAG